MTRADSRLRITILTSPSGWGGMEKHTVRLARMLGERGHWVTIAEFGSSRYGDAGLAADGRIRRISLDCGKDLSQLGVAEAVGLLCSLAGDLCIFQKGWFLEGSWQVDLAARMTFSRYITIEHQASLPMPPRSHGRHLFGLVPGLGLWWYRLLWKGLVRAIAPHRIVCVSETIERLLVDHNRFPAAKVTTVHNGIDPDRFRPDPELRERTRERLGIPRDAIVFGAVGRLTAVKGFDVALSLFRELFLTTPCGDAWFVLAGDGPEREPLERLIAEPEVRKRLRIIPFTDRPWELYPAIDLFVMTSRNEGLPLSLLEAMACGCCPVAMGVGGVPDAIATPEEGWLVPAGDRVAFFEAMKAAIRTDRSRRSEMGMNARRRVVARFNEAVQYRALVRLIEAECAGAGVPVERRRWYRSGLYRP